MSFFRPRKIKDPISGEERIVSPEEQMEMLEKGIVFDVPSEVVDDEPTRGAQQTSPASDA